MNRFLPLSQLAKHAKNYLIAAGQIHSTAGFAKIKKYHVALQAGTLQILVAEIKLTSPNKIHCNVKACICHVMYDTCVLF